MSLQLRNKTSGALERVAGFNDTDSILSPNSKNPISNKAVYNALLQKIDKTVTDLINYYDKSQVYTKPEVRALIGSINTLTIEVVSQLPTQDISTTTIYFVGPAAGTNNYDEYVYVGGNWVQIGDTTIDLSNYVTSANLTTVLQDYYTKSEVDALFDDYYDKDAVDDLLDTKQNTLTFDNTPIAGSQNPVTSAGIKTALDNILISGNGGSIIKVHHLAGAAAAGNTVTASKGSYSVSSTFDVSGDAIIIGFGEIGHITIICSNGSETGTTYIDIPSFSSYSTVISYGLDYVTWLTKAGIDASYYESLDDIFADEEAVRKLMTKHASVDYLATVDRADDEMALAVFNNDICAKWINLRDYALDTLYANDVAKAMMDDADKYGYGEWALVGQVPKMTSNTAPYGQAISSNAYSTYPAYYAFDRNSETMFASNAASCVNQYLGYKFLNPVKINTISFIENIAIYTGYRRMYTYNIEASNDNTSWVKLAENVEVPSGKDRKHVYYSFENEEEYLYYRIYCITGSAELRLCFAELQFYAWQPKGNVPVMTSYTAPYGQAIYDGTILSQSGTTYYPWQLFDNNYDTIGALVGTSGRIGYKFVNPIMAKKAFIQITNSGTYRIIGSNDGTTWTDLTENITISTSHDYTEATLNNNSYYIYYGIRCISLLSGSNFGLHALQFYGREMKASVPAMTNYTTPYGTITSSTDYAAGYNAVKAFDKQGNSTWWHSTAGVPQWIGYEFIKPIIVKMVEIKPFSSSSVTDSVTLKVQAFETSTNSWIDLSDLDVYSGSVDKTFSVNNENAYSMYRIYSTDTSYVSSGSKYVRFNTIQFYGFDYSERDWDTEHPMKYIYDHGVELDEFIVNVTNASNASVTKTPNQLLYKTSAVTYTIAQAYKNIDLSDYNLVCINTGDSLYNSGGNTGANIFGTIAVSNAILDGNYSGTLVNVGFNTDTGLPYKISADVSNINEAKYLSVVTGNKTAGQTRTMTINEWWLE